MANPSIEILTIWGHYFKLALRTAEVDYTIQNVDGNKTICDY